MSHIFHTLLDTFFVAYCKYGHPVIILVTDFTNPEKLTNDHLILKSLTINKSLVNQMMQIVTQS